MARPMWGCGTGFRSCPRPIPTPLTRRACWRRATSCSTACKRPSSHKAEIVKLLAQARPAPARGREAAESSATVSVPIRSRARAAEKPVTVLGYVEREENGRRVKTDTPKDYTLHA